MLMRTIRELDGLASIGATLMSHGGPVPEISDQVMYNGILMHAGECRHSLPFLSNEGNWINDLPLKWQSVSRKAIRKIISRWNGIVAGGVRSDPLPKMILLTPWTLSSGRQATNLTHYTVNEFAMTHISRVVMGKKLSDHKVVLCFDLTTTPKKETMFREDMQNICKYAGDVTMYLVNDSELSESSTTNYMNIWAELVKPISDVSFRRVPVRVEEPLDRPISLESIFLSLCKLRAFNGFNIDWHCTRHDANVKDVGIRDVPRKVNDKRHGSSQPHRHEYLNHDEMNHGLSSHNWPNRHR